MTPRLPALESLRVFEASARHQNFTRAGRELGVTPTAVSLRIRDLERELGVALFRRSGPRIALTERGVALAVRLGSLLEGFRVAVDECRSVAPPLRLTVTPTLAARWLGPRLAAFHKRPGVPSIVLDVSSDVRTTEEYDVAVRSGDGTWPGTRALPLPPRTSAPMLSPALAAEYGVSTPRDLAALPLLADGDWPRWFAEMSIDAPLYHGPVRYPTQELAAAAAVAGEGVALLSPALFAALLDVGDLLQPFAHTVTSSGGDWVLVHSNEQRMPVIDLADWLARD